MLLLLDTGGEEELIGLSGVSSTSKSQRPQAINLDGLMLRTHERTEEGACSGVEGVDMPVTKIADQQVVAEATEIGRGECYPPGRVELTARDEAFEQVAIVVKDIQKAATLTGQIVMPGLILLRIGDIEIAANTLDVKRSVPLRYVWVLERTFEFDMGKFLVEDIERSGVEIGGVEIGIRVDGSNRQPFVDRSSF